MRSVVLLLLGAHLAYAGTHSLRYFYTAVSGDIDFPEFTAVGLVDDGQFMYFDSNIMKAVPKTEWIRQNEGADYWDSQTQGLIGSHQTYKNNIQIAKERFNQSKGVHTLQVMYGCELNDDGSTQGFRQYGYDGEDFLSLDKNTLTWTAANSQAVITKVKWEATGAAANYWKGYLENTCIEWLKKYVNYGKGTLDRKDPPEVSLLQKDPSSPVICHATGFYPKDIMMTWQKNKDEHFEDVEVSTTLPNADGTFQKTTTLSIKSEEWKMNPGVYKCVVQHVGSPNEIVVFLDEDSFRTIPASDNKIVIVICVVVAAVLAAIIGFFVYRRFKQTKNPNATGYVKGSNTDTDSEKSDEPLQGVATHTSTGTN